MNIFPEWPLIHRIVSVPLIGKVVGKIGDLEKKGKALEAAAKNTKFTKYPSGFDEGLLPSVPNRTWYEADVNYISGYRGNDRILYSSDGLVYKTSDHYKTLTEIK
ncbi:ribonuclease domain-containing protein [Bacillus mycoides]|uniref:ribonuclease domain-containing protein n=1 Tax=Bacillus mycoides TaxID=1405 RepID=UPI003649E718